MRIHVYPVIHVQSLDEVLDQVRIAARQDIDGVFLIDHDADDKRLSHCLREVRQAQPELFLGVNYIRRTAAESVRLLSCQAIGVRVDAIWADHAGVGVEGPEPAITDLAVARQELDWGGVHFGGIAFKHQAPVPAADLSRLARVAAQHVDIPTTSGPGTGQEANLAKLRALRNGLVDHPLALASGVSSNNIHSLRGLVDHILVATGINDDHDRIDESKLDRLLTAARF